MAILPFSARDRAELYAQRRNLTIDKIYGGGYDGLVLGTNAGTAIKSLNNTELYRNELSVYLHMKKNKIFMLSGFTIPKLLNFEAEHSIIEMTVVSPPYVVDFAGARLVRPEPFSDEIIEYWVRQKREEFGEDWPRVSRLLFAFESRGIFLTDVHTKNVACR